jgi:hypothetical protein
VDKSKDLCLTWQQIAFVSGALATNGMASPILAILFIVAGRAE